MSAAGRPPSWPPRLDRRHAGPAGAQLVAHGREAGELGVIEGPLERDLACPALLVAQPQRHPPTGTRPLFPVRVDHLTQHHEVTGSGLGFGWTWGQGDEPVVARLVRASLTRGAKCSQ
jgi:hypothetical protein